MNKTYFFVAFYDTKHAYCYDAENNRFLPYYPAHNRRKYADIDQARAAARYARHHNPDKRQNIYVDAAIMKGAAENV